MLGLERPFHWHVDVVGLLLRQLAQVDAQLLQMQTRNFFVQVLGQHINLARFVGFTTGKEFDLSNGLVGEGGGHDERWVARSAAQVNQTTLGQQDDALAIGEDHVIDLWLDLFPLQIFQASNVDFRCRSDQCCKQWPGLSFCPCGHA